MLETRYSGDVPPDLGSKPVKLPVRAIRLRLTLISDR